MRYRSSELARGVSQPSVKQLEKENSNLETLDSLQQILLKQEREKLAELSESVKGLNQLIAPKVLADNLEPYIGEILAKRFAESPEEMAQLLSPIVAASLKYQVREARDDVTEILYPIMAEAINRQIREGEIVDVFYPLIGRMIAKAVLEAVKNLIRKLGENLRKVFGFKAKRAKAPTESDVPTEYSVPFDIEDAFLIHRESGVLICHVSNQPAEKEIDERLISGTLKAIRDVLRESLEEGGKQNLDQIQRGIRFGAKQILLESELHACVAVVISGVEPTDFHEQLARTVSQIHHNFEGQLKNYDGDNSKFAGVERQILALMDMYEAPPERESGEKIKITPRALRKRLTPIRQYLAVALIVALTVFCGGFLFYYYIPRNKPKVQQNIAINNPKSQAERENILQAEIENILTGKPILFNTAETSIQPKRQDTLNEIVKVLKRYPLVNVRIIGYSDTSDEDNINSEPPISLERAKAVKEYLENNGIPPSRLQTMDGGVGKFSVPTTPSGQMMNRRVEFEVVRYENMESSE